MGWCWTNRIGSLQRQFPTFATNLHHGRGGHGSSPLRGAEAFQWAMFNTCSAGMFIFLTSSIAATSAKASHFDYLTSPNPAGCCILWARESQWALAPLATFAGAKWRCTESRRAAGEAAPRQGPRQVCPWEGSAGESSEQLRWGILGFLLSARVICGAHLCFKAAAVKHPSAKIPQQTQSLALPPGFCEQHSFLALAVDPACRVLSPQEYSPFTKQDHKAVT